MSKVQETKAQDTTLFGAGVSSAMGFVFGCALEKGRVFAPELIVQQMLFKKFVMLKMFLGAGATTMVVFSAYSAFQPARKLLEDARNRWSPSNGRGVFAVAIGAGLLGVGMSLSGACPGTVAAQLGAGVPEAKYTIGGAFVATLVYGYMAKHLEGFVSTKPIWTGHKQTLDRVLNVPYWKTGMPMALALAAVVGAVEIFVAPWATEVTTGGSDALHAKAWPPILSGVLIGLNQLPALWALGKGIGSATGYATCVSKTLHAVLPSESVPSYFKTLRNGMGNHFQLFYLSSAALGAFVSASLSGQYGVERGTSPALSFLGGACILFGSRLAGGCTSGHGVTGMGMQFMASMVAVPCMFAGGIATALVLNANGVYRL
eukprot:CAMPEP_0114561560 /NCGR_PEP_ID=MMETSP0114-20121206/12069_1 /TAXON_ID=31324 /ORGANISM="Goniomonas sp, Strain m" /LENGTH=373 /DNA_ID=CAMNT_0001747203 /DNA_START=15 /DNA_END=1136 /DNA_ORIENTATION=+